MSEVQSYYERNKEAVLRRNKEWRDNNKERMAELNKQSRLKHRLVFNERARKRHYTTKYGITIEERNALLFSQNNKCAACGTVDPGAKQGWAVDHNHTTGRVRGILCQPCNRAIGHAKENIHRLKALVVYLEQNNDLD